MNQAVKQIIVTSIKRWREIEKYPTLISINYCPLYALVPQKDFALANRCCVGCPIYEYSGLTACSSSPFIGFNIEEIRNRAKEEADFLEKVLNYDSKS